MHARAELTTFTSKLGYHLQTKSSTFLSPQNLFTDIAKCDKSTDRADFTIAMLSQLVAMRSTFTIFSNGSIIPPGFKFTELNALTLAAHSYALLSAVVVH